MIAAMFAGPVTQVRAAQDYYPATGHYLFGQFLDYWNGNGGILRFGQPVTKVLNAQSENGQTYPTQYLERAVLEYHPENAGTLFEVLGRRLAATQTIERAKTDPSFQKVTNPNAASRTFFGETGHTTGGDTANDAIRKYWEDGGNGDRQRSILVFGFPISEPFDERNPAPPAGDGMNYRVQYFERYRLEYHPEQSDPKFRVLLGLLGTSQVDLDGIRATDPNRVTEAANQTQPACVQAAVGGVCTGGRLPRNSNAIHVGEGRDGYGFNVDGIGLDGTSKDAVFGKVQEAQFGWVRQQVRWSSVEPQKGAFANPYVDQLDRFVDSAKSKGLRILFSPVDAPDWTGTVRLNGIGGIPPNSEDFARFMDFLATRYAGKIEAYEMWNEQNYAFETGGTVDVSKYLPLLRAGYNALKAKDRNITVVFGGMTPTGVNDTKIAINEVDYLKQFYALNGGEGKRYYDALGAHPGSNCNPPDNEFPANPATNPCGNDPDGGRKFTKDNSFYFKRILEMRKVMEDNGEGRKQMWLTEFGWDSTMNPPMGYEYASFISEDQQAQYLTRAFELGKSYPWMGVMFVWNLNFQQTLADRTGDEKWGWGILRSDLSPRPAFTSLKNLPK